MDKLMGMAKKLSSNSSSSTGTTNTTATTGGDPAMSGNTGMTGTTGTTGTTSAAGNEDYGDKAMAFLEKKTGHSMGRDTNEKITDGIRGQYEKMTGKQVNPKYSN